MQPSAVERVLAKEGNTDRGTHIEVMPPCRPFLEEGSPICELVDSFRVRLAMPSCG